MAIGLSYVPQRVESRIWNVGGNELTGSLQFKWAETPPG
jgi:hypothetical protein